MLTDHARGRTSYASGQGFTLPELMIVIVLLGILAAIAIPSWFGIVESRNATGAANQVAADLRLAHSRSTNRLSNVEFEVLPNGSYRFDGINRSVPDQFRIYPSTTMTFKSDGQISGAATLRVQSRDGSKTFYDIVSNPQTSEVEIVPIS